MVKNIAENTMEGDSFESDIRLNEQADDKDSQIKARLEALLHSKYVIDQIHDAIIATDLNGIIISWNKGAERQLGYTATEVVGRPIYRLYPEEGHYYLTSDVLAILKDKGSIEIEKTMIRKSGEIFYVYNSLSPLADETGEIIGIISYSLDISERKRIEKSLKLSEERFELAVAGSNDGIWDWDIQTNEVYYSPRFKELLGYTEEEFPNSLDSFKGHLHADDSDEVWNAVANHLENRSPYDIEYRFRKKSGEYCWYRSRGQAIWDDTGKATRMSGSVRDLDDKKKAEIELTRYKDRLEELVHERTADLEQVRENLLKSSLSLKALSQSNHAMIHATDEQKLLDEICRIIVEVGNYSMAWVCYAVHDENKSIQAMAVHGVEKDYVENLNLTWADVEYGQRPTGAAIRTANPVLITNTLKDPRFESWRDHAIELDICSIAAFPLLDKDRLAFGALTIFSTGINYFGDEEASLMAELAENLTYGVLALRTSEELLQKERMAVLGQLLATVSHELRNPLGTIHTSLYTLAQKITGKDQALLEKQIARAERSVIRCDTIIEELLDFTRSSELRLEETPLDDWCNEILNEYEFPDDIEIVKNLSSGATVNMEREKIRRCLINILNNACQAMLQPDISDLGKPFKLNFLTNQSDNKIWIEINDTGPGIAKSELSKIFEPLYSTKTYGVGLGLPIVKQIMEHHSGGISVSSKLGEGTSIKLWLP